MVFTDYPMVIVLQSGGGYLNKYFIVFPLKLTNGKFQKYDYGSKEKNLEKYKTDK